MVVAFLRGCCWLSLVLCGSGPVLVAVVVAVSGGCVAGDSGGDGDYGGSGLVLLGGLGVRGFGSRRLTDLTVGGDEGVTSFPEGMFRNLTFLQSLKISNFPKLKELPNEPLSQALKHLRITDCQFESLPEEIWESLPSLRSLQIDYCKGLRCFPEAEMNHFLITPSLEHVSSERSEDINVCHALQWKFLRFMISPIS
ncbi:hypothetical protein P8452_43565 [Trifolium repens]|nr:hypothetical protein P8452_43565 [Trifolium repens]